VFDVNDVIHHDAKPSDIWLMGHIISTLGILVVLHKIALHVKYWTMVNVFFHFASLVVFFLCLIGISAFVDWWPQGYFTFYVLVQSPIYYLAVALGFVVCLLPDFTTRYLSRQLFPEQWQILQEQARKNKEKEWKKEFALEEFHKRTRTY